MDYITGLPESKMSSDDSVGFDAILVVVDRLTKLVTLIPSYSTANAESTARAFFNNVVCRFGMPKDIVTDRGTVFLSNFQQELQRALGVKQLFSTAYRPQTDGQTERVNRVVGDALRNLAGYDLQSDWVSKLAAVEFAMNNSFHASIATTPFRLVHGVDPRMPLSTVPPLDQLRCLATRKFITDNDAALREARQHMQLAQSRAKAYYDAKHRAVSFQSGDLVLLSTKNLKLKNPTGSSSTKLMPKFIGPFPVQEVVGNQAYRLQLPLHLKVHNVFHVSLLKKYLHKADATFQPALQIPDVETDDTLYEVERIMSHRAASAKRRHRYKSAREYLVKWLNYDESEATWEPESLVKHLDAFEDYWKANQPAPPSVLRRTTVTFTA